MKVHEATLSWGECDPAGIIYYATYLTWAERLHSEWWLERGFHLSDMHEALGARFSVRHLEVDYRSPPRPLERMRASLAVARLGTTSFAVEVTFTRPADETLLAILTLTAVWTSPERRPVPIPAPARAALEAAA
jgi:YbgC/YbaW family acyl-CoA thioester hydrolase